MHLVATCAEGAGQPRLRPQLRPRRQRQPRRKTASSFHARQPQIPMHLFVDVVVYINIAFHGDGANVAPIFATLLRHCQRWLNLTLLSEAPGNTRRPALSNAGLGGFASRVSG